LLRKAYLFFFSTTIAQTILSLCVIIRNELGKKILINQIYDIQTIIEQHTHVAICMFFEFKDNFNISN
jgi:hypothetical protein